ncbi:MAG TPA: tetratricopeptide repeat protein [Ohtaekwangia sp.]|nr:tetratricopeptide repeat protein [Ohtaekwangia sp.]
MKRFYFAFAVFFYCLSPWVNAQTIRFDSLNALLPTTKSNERFDVLYQLVREVWADDMELALCYADEAIGIVPQLSDSMRIGKAYRVKGHLLFLDGRVSEALPWLHIAHRVCRSVNNFSELTYILNLFGITYTYNGEYGEALRCLLEAIELRETNDGLNLGVLYSNLGLVYYKLRNFKKALAYYELSSTIELEDFQGDAILSINKGLASAQNKKFCEALEYINHGLSLCKRGCDDTFVDGEFALGLIDFVQGNSIEAEGHFNKSLEISRKINDQRFEVENLIYLAKIDIESKHYDQAYSSLGEAQRIAQIHNFNELLINIYDAYILFFEQRKDFRRMDFYYPKYNELRERLHGQEMLQQIVVQEAELEHEENKRTIAYQKDLVEAQVEALKLERRIQLAIGSLTLIVGIILFLLYKRVLQKRKINTLLATRVTQRKAELATAVDGLKSDRRIIQQMASLAMEVCGSLSDKSCVQLSMFKVNRNNGFVRMIQLSLLELNQLSNNTVKTKEELVRN